MPELPEVETVRRALLPHLIGRRMLDVTAQVPKLRRPLNIAALRAACAGRRIRDLRRRGKYLVADLDGPDALLLHLGMTGAFVIRPDGQPPDRHQRVEWRLDDGQLWRFLDPRMFGLVEVCQPAAPDGWPDALTEMGPEPLSPEFDGRIFQRLTRGRACPVKHLLLDQHAVAVIGNIYASEACHRARIRPARPAATLTRPECNRLATSVKQIMEAAIRCGGTTINDFRSVDGSEGKFTASLEVYGRTGEPCHRCGAPHRVRREVSGGRASFFCPHCQK